MRRMVVPTLVFAGCAVPPFGTPAEPPDGWQLVAGRDVTGPSFVTTFATPDVMFTRTPAGTEASSDPFAPVDLLTVPQAGGADARLLVANLSPKLHQEWDASGHVYAVRDEHDLVAEGNDPNCTTGMEAKTCPDPVAAGTLVRVDYPTGSTEVIGDVTGYEVASAQSLVAYHTQAAPGTLPDVNLRTPDGTTFHVGPASGERFLQGRLYYIGGTGRTLERVAPPDGAHPRPQPDVLEADIEKFLPRSDGQVAIAVGGAASGQPLLALDLATRKSPVKLPGSGGVCCLLGYSPDGKQYAYAEGHAAPGTGKLHIHTFASDGAPARDDAFDPPSGSGNLRGAMWRPGSTMILLGDGVGTLSRLDPAVSPTIEPIGRTGLVPAFVRDGRILVFIDPGSSDHGTNRLLAMDADNLTPDAPVRELTPPGSIADGYFTFGGLRNVGFWAHFDPDARDDLYLADPEAGTNQLVAREVGPTAVSSTTVIGIVRKNRSDQTGDLVRIDVASGSEQQIAGAVSDFALAPACPGCDAYGPGALIAYIVRGRFASQLDGLWGTVLR